VSATGKADRPQPGPQGASSRDRASPDTPRLMFDRWCKERNHEIRQRILDYNEDDCRATRVLLDGVRSLAA